MSLLIELLWRAIKQVLVQLRLSIMLMILHCQFLDCSFCVVNLEGRLHLSIHSKLAKVFMRTMSMRLIALLRLSMV